MKVVSISTDKKIFEEGSSVRERMKEYGSLFEEFHIVVFTSHKDSFKKVRLSSNTWAYPTQSFSKLTYISCAKRIAKKIVKPSRTDTWVATTQDPFETGLVGAYLKRKYGVRFNVQIHADIYSPYFEQSSFLNKIRMHIAPDVLRSADSIRVVSRRIHDSLVKRGVSQEKITILPIFIDRGVYDGFQDVPQKDNTVLAVSRLSQEKNLFFLLDVIEKVIDEGTRLTCIIVGDGPLRSDLEQYVREKQLEHVVEIVGWKHDMSRWYRRAGVFMHTSLFEGYGLVLAEAALHHIPILTSDVGAVGSVFHNKKSAVVCGVRDKDCFARGLKRLLTDKRYAQQISESAYNAIQATIPQDKAHYLSLYKQSL